LPRSVWWPAIALVPSAVDAHRSDSRSVFANSGRTATDPAAALAVPAEQTNVTVLQIRFDRQEGAPQSQPQECCCECMASTGRGICGATMQRDRSLRHWRSSLQRRGSSSAEHVHFDDVSKRRLRPARSRHLAARFADRRRIFVATASSGRPPNQAIGQRRQLRRPLRPGKLVGLPQISYRAITKGRDARIPDVSNCGAPIYVALGKKRDRQKCVRF
jgi:hypothetical protein